MGEHRKGESGRRPNPLRRNKRLLRVLCEECGRGEGTLKNVGEVGKRTRFAHVDADECKRVQPKKKEKE